MLFLDIKIFILICHNVQSHRPKKKKLKVFQGKLEDLGDMCEVQKSTKPELSSLHEDIEKCLKDTAQQVREINKVTLAVASHKNSIQNGNVALLENNHLATSI